MYVVFLFRCCFISSNVILYYLQYCAGVYSLTVYIPSECDKMSFENDRFYSSTFANLPPEKRERIISVITEEFADNGFEHTSILQIAKRSGISVGSVYKYFESKETMFMMVVREGLSELENTLRNISISDDDVALKTEYVLRELLRFSREKPALVKLYCAITTDGNNDFITGFSQQIEALSAMTYISAVREGQKSGDIRSDIDAGYFAFLLDNVFMMLQYSTACEYYKKRFKIYTGQDPEESDELIIAQTMKFLKAAFNFK